MREQAVQDPGGWCAPSTEALYDPVVEDAHQRLPDFPEAPYPELPTIMAQEASRRRSSPARYPH